MRYVLRISYDGTNYAGFQKQDNAVTIQSVLEDVLSKVCKTDIQVVGSGRTDAGVSAIEQVCHFDIDSELDTRKVKGYANSILPKDIRLMEISLISEDFHARFSAKQKTYEYYFYTNSEVIPVYDNFATYIGYNLDISKMQSACKFFVGEYDFTSFCASNTSVVDKVRTIYNMDIVEVNDGLYKLSITGNGFLYNMVRIIMGTLVDVGLGKILVENISNVIESKDRTQAGKTISAHGLYLKKVIY